VTNPKVLDFTRTSTAYLPIYPKCYAAPTPELEGIMVDVNGHALRTPSRSPNVYVPLAELH
jgi:hypothetical protein